MQLGQATADTIEAGLAIFQEEATAGYLFLGMTIACVLLLVVYLARTIAAPLRALDRAWRAVNTMSFVSASDEFASALEREQRLDEAVQRAGAGSREGRRILLAWRRRQAALRGGLPSGEDAVVKPASVLGPQPRWLSVAADAFVGIGLVFTFLGLVAALAAAADVVAGGGDPQIALLALLGAASVKFLTSIAGIAGAVLMRLWQAYWLGRVSVAAARLSLALDEHLLGTAAP